MKGTPYTCYEEAFLESAYPFRNTAEIAAALNRDKDSIYRKAHAMGMKKTREYILKYCRFKKGSGIGSEYRYKKGNIPANKGKKMPPELYSKLAKSMFKKGHEPSNARQDGALSVRVDKQTGIAYLYIRLAKRNWQPLHRVLWEKHNGPTPRGFNIIFRDGNHSNISIDNLEMLSNAELMVRNSFHNKYPEDLQKMIQLAGALQRQINKLTK